MSGSAVGLVIGDRFRLVRLMGEGGMGSVYEAEHTTLARRFAIKILRRNLAAQTRFVERFRREAVAASRLDHPNIVRISDFGQLEGGEFYLVMELLDGAGIDHVLRTQGRMPVVRALPILAQLADALDFAHREKVVHRDLKPENVFLCNVRGQREVVKVLDFGIARIQTATFAGRLTIQGQVFGTAEYVSPEQAIDAPLDGRSDLYSVGVLAFEMTTGAVPFEGNPAEVLRAHVERLPPPPSSRLPAGSLPAAFDAIVLRLLAKKPEARYASGAELRRDLLRLRGLLTAAAADMLDGAGDGRLPRDIVDSGGWRPLGSRPPALHVVPQIPASAIAALSAPQPSEPVPVARVWRDPRDLRRQVQITLRKIGLALAEAAYREQDLRAVLREILVLEEEIGSLANQIAVLEQNFERIRFEAGERETTLRYAILDLSSERARAIARGATRAQIEDLRFQLGELQKRLEESLAAKGRQTKDLAAEVAEQRKEREAREREAAERYGALAEMVDRMRENAGGVEEFVALYAELDELRAQLKRARDTLPP